MIDNKTEDEFDHLIGELTWAIQHHAQIEKGANKKIWRWLDQVSGVDVQIDKPDNKKIITPCLKALLSSNGEEIIAVEGVADEEAPKFLQTLQFIIDESKELSDDGRKRCSAMYVWDRYQSCVKAVEAVHQNRIPV